MKKSNFITLMLGTISGAMFSLGMCMALLPEWNAFKEGIILGTIGFVLSLITFIAWFKMENKKLPKISGRVVLKALYGIISFLVLGVGMCLCLVWNNIVWGTLIGLLGIVMIICLIPIIKGIK
jgi:hypothetical protein